jgi:hypothetical protein
MKLTPQDKLIIALEFASYGGIFSNAIEETARLCVMTAEELEEAEARESEKGCKTHYLQNPVPTEEEAAFARRFDKLIEVQDRIERGKAFIDAVKARITAFYDAHPECNAWKEAKEELNQMKARAKKLGINIWASEQKFWNEHRGTWLACKAAWESEAGQRCKKDFDLLGRAWERLKELYAQRKELRVSDGMWDMYNRENDPERDWYSEYFTTTGEVYWSQEHLTEEERWYWQNTDNPRERAAVEFYSMKEMWK